MSKNGGIDVKELKKRLKDKGVKVPGRAGAEKLVALAEANSVSVPKASKGAGMIADEYRKKYGKEQTVGDDVAQALRKATTVTKEGVKRPVVDPKALKKVAQDNDLTSQFNAWSGLNIGQQRMNLGNVLRGRHNRGERVVIGSKVFKGEAQGTGGKL